MDLRPTIIIFILYTLLSRSYVRVVRAGLSLYGEVCSVDEVYVANVMGSRYHSFDVEVRVRSSCASA